MDSEETEDNFIVMFFTKRAGATRLFLCLFNAVYNQTITNQNYNKKIAIIFLAIALCIVGYLALNKKERTPSVLQTDPTKVTVTGIIRNAGLSSSVQPSEKDGLRLKFADFQITNIVGATNDINGYFLEDNSEEIKKSLNKCVTVSGKIKDDWKNINAQNTTLNGIYTYNNSALQDIKIVKELPLTKCSMSQILKPEQYEEKTYEGVVREIQRPAPDIPYDYIFEFTTPQEIANAAGMPTINHIVIIPTSIKEEETLRKTLGNIIKLTGYVTWGYAESTVLYITSIK